MPQIRFDFRSSGLSSFKYNLVLDNTDLSINYANGNPEITKLLALRYAVKPQNIFISSEGASGQNARIIRFLAEINSGKNEAIVEYPTYEPLLRLVQEYFPRLKRLERNEADGYALDADLLRRLVSDKTGLLVLTNPHAPSGAVSGVGELREIMSIADQHSFYVLCDEIYAEFERGSVPTFFSIDSDHGVVTTSFSKAYGLGGLKLGIALVNERLADELRLDLLNTAGTGSNLVEMFAAKLLTEGSKALEAHKQKWVRVKPEMEKRLDAAGFEYFPSRIGVTFWLKLPVKDTYRWINETAIPRYGLAAVPGAFFLFKDDYELAESGMVRLGLGNINPDKPDLNEAFGVLEEALKSCG